MLYIYIYSLCGFHVNLYGFLLWFCVPSCIQMFFLSFFPMRSCTPMYSRALLHTQGYVCTHAFVDLFPILYLTLHLGPIVNLLKPNQQHTQFPPSLGSLILDIIFSFIREIDLQEFTHNINCPFSTNIHYQFKWSYSILLVTRPISNSYQLHGQLINSSPIEWASNW